jgi:hypothetical protein
MGDHAPYGAHRSFFVLVRDAPPPALQVFGARRIGKVAKVVVYTCRGPKMIDSMSGRLGLLAFAMRAFDRQQFPWRETPFSGSVSVAQRFPGGQGMMPLSKSSRPPMPKRQSRRGLERRDGKHSKS